VLIVRNREVTSAEGIRHIWFNSASPDFFPLTASFEWLEWQAFGGQAMGFHVVSILLHGLSGCLLWWLLRRIGIRGAWLAAVIFAVHPLAVESVAWISEQKNTLSLPLLLLAMIYFVDFDDTRRIRLLIIALACFVGALLCKTSVVMLPVTVLGYLWWKRGSIRSRDLIVTIPFFVISILFGTITIWFQHQRAMVDWILPPLPFGDKVMRAVDALSFYAVKCTVPVHLMPIYPAWPTGVRGLGEFAAVVAVIVVALSSWRWRATWGRHVGFGFGFFAINLLPVLGLVGMAFMRYSWVADHFAYVASIGIVVGGVGASLWLIPRSLASGWLGRILAGVVVAALVLMSRNYSRVFRNDEALWMHTRARNATAWLAENNLGELRLKAGDVAAAIPYFKAALVVNPDCAEARGNLGVALSKLGQAKLAIVHLERAIALTPRDSRAHGNLGNALTQIGRLNEAIVEYRLALQLAPDDPDAGNNLANTLYAVGRTAEAIACYENAVARQPDYPLLRENFGVVLIRAGRFAAAAEQLERAKHLGTRTATLEGNLGLAYVQAGRMAEGIAAFERAAELDSKSAVARVNIGVSLLRAGRTDAARVQFERALVLDPTNIAAREAISRIAPR
jgi:protein O-mannosyl-transferase